METMQAEKPKAVHPVVQIAQALVDDVRRRGEVAELLYGTEKTRFARMLLEQADEIDLLRQEKAKLIAVLDRTSARLRGAAYDARKGTSHRSGNPIEVYSEMADEWERQAQEATSLLVELGVE